MNNINYGKTNKINETNKMNKSEMTQLFVSWNLWVHPFDSVDWTISGYNKILTLDTIEDYWIMINNIKNWENGMYYLIKDGYFPLWEDERLKNGDGWCFKILKTDVNLFWKELTSYGILELLLKDKTKSNSIIGLSCSPKSKFATVRVWTSNKLSVNDFVSTKSINFNKSIIIKND